MCDFKLLSSFLETKDFCLSEDLKLKFKRYYQILVEANRRVNLTAITDIYDVEEKHFMDSVAPASFFDFNLCNSIIDIGTGAGFPGVPLKLIFSHLKLVLVDSLNKRVDFLKTVVKELDLKDTVVLHGRAEELGRLAEHREQYDVCVSRAVSRLSSLVELCMPFVRTGGAFIPYKSRELDAELEEAEYAIELLGGKTVRVFELNLGARGLQRRFPVIEKITETPTKYPRKNGVPQKKPLTNSL